MIQDCHEGRPRIGKPAILSRASSVLEGQAGAVFAIDGRVVGLELFDSAETLRKLFPKLLRSYGLDALDRARSKPSREETQCAPEKAGAFLEKLRGGSCHWVGPMQD